MDAKNNPGEARCAYCGAPAAVEKLRPDREPVWLCMTCTIGRITHVQNALSIQETIEILVSLGSLQPTPSAPVRVPVPPLGTADTVECECQRSRLSMPKDGIREAEVPLLAERFALSKGGEVTRYIGQCPYCRRIYWHD